MKVTRSEAQLWAGVISPTWLIESDALRVTVADHGAHVLSVVLLLRDGDIEMSVPYPPGADSPKGAHGASIGRYANRIAQSRFTIDGTGYRLAPNEGPNQLHGGPVGFHLHDWHGDGEVVDDTATIELADRSPDGDQGFPGEVHVTARFALMGATLTVTYGAVTTAPTPINMTSHLYWNLSGGGRLEGHQLAVAAPAYVAVDEANIPLPGPPMSVEGTRFDCRAPRDVASVIATGGYDHSFALGPAPSDLNTDREPAASLIHASGRRLDLHTDQVGLQVYTGRHLAPDRQGIALESQCHPNTPNRPDLGDCTVRPGQTYRAATSFAFSW